MVSLIIYTMKTKIDKKYFYNNFFKEQLSINKEEAGDPENSLKYIESLNISRDAIILDIGTHIGSLPAKLYQAAYLNVRGLDISEEAIKYGQTKYPFLKENLFSFDGEKLPFSDKIFDVVLMFDVLEHIPDINNFLSEINRVLKPNGLLVFLTPNKITNIIWTLFSTKSFKKTKSFIQNDHCSLQTLLSLKKLLKNSSFTDVKIEKNYLRNEYDKNKINKKLGAGFLFLLPLFKILPLALFPNFWGVAKKSS